MLLISKFSQATDDVAEGIIEEDYALFYEIWQEFDPEATTYIAYENVAELLDCLEPPLQVTYQKYTSGFSMHTL